MMKSNYQIIRSYLEYGHKVEVVNKRMKEKHFFVYLVNDEEVLSHVGQRYSSGDSFFEGELTITPIPHRYKKLEVGTKVDVLEGYDRTLAAEGPYRVHQNDGEYTITIALPHKIIGGVPLWAITPHVEE